LALDDIREPILGEGRIALDLPTLTEPVYLDMLLDGRRRSPEKARVAWTGLVSLLTPRVAPPRVLVDRFRNCPSALRVNCGLA